MERKVVIARYNEPTDWVHSIDFDYIIYNKGPKIEDERIPQEKIIEIPNEGREAETFLRYIVSNYNSLPDSIAFLQGNPFDHFPDTLEFINSEEEKGMIRMGPQTFCDRNGRDSYPGLPVGDIQKMIMPLLELDKINFTAGAQLMIDREFILNKPLEWWGFLLNFYNSYWFSDIESGYGHKPGVFIAHVFERLWEYIFRYEIK
jgi:hypothetical protein